MSGQWRWKYIRAVGQIRANWVPFFGALVVGVVLGLLLVWGAAALKSIQSLTLANAVKAGYSVLKDGVIAVGAIVTLYFAFKRMRAEEAQTKNQTEAIKAQTKQLRLNAKQIKLSRRDQLSRRFQEAVYQLGSKKQEVRLGGIAGLWAVATESTHPEDRIMVLDVLCAFVRNAPHPADDEPQKIKPDVALAMDRLGSVGPYFPWKNGKYKREKKENKPYRRDFSGAFFKGHSFNNLNLVGSIFKNVNLDNSSFIKCDITESMISFYNTKSVGFSDCNLTKSSLRFSFLVISIIGPVIDKVNIAGIANSNLSGVKIENLKSNGSEIQLTDSYYFEGFSPSGLRTEQLSALEVRPAP